MGVTHGQKNTCSIILGAYLSINLSPLSRGMGKRPSVCRSLGHPWAALSLTRCAHLWIVKMNPAPVEGNGMEEVVGSNPTRSTNPSNQLQ